MARHRVHGTIPEGFGYPVNATFRPPYPVSDLDAERAYCSVWGLPWSVRVVCEIPATMRPHPRSYKPDVSHKASRTSYLRGQREAFA